MGSRMVIDKVYINLIICVFDNPVTYKKNFTDIGCWGVIEQTNAYVRMNIHVCFNTQENL